jgi:hypothetical protein
MRTRVALLACLSCLAPALALGQTAGAIVVTEVVGDVLDEKINLAECKSSDLAGGTIDEITLAWALGTTPAAGSTLTVWASDTSACPPTSTNKVQLESGLATTAVRSPSSGGTWNVGTDVFRKSGSGWSVTCDATSSTATIYFCVSIEPSSGAATSGATGPMVLDRTIPRKPVITSILPGEGALNVAWSAGTTGGSGTTATYSVTATAAGQPARTESGITGLDRRLTGLTNGVTYSVTVTAYTASNNPSEASDAAQGTPVPVQDFWERYQEQQGVETGGCGAGGTSLLSLLALAGLAPRLLRRRP